LWRFNPIIALWDWNLKSGSLMLHSLHLKRSEDCNLDLITAGKLNTEVNNYVPFWQNNYFKWTKCFISFIFTTERVFYNSHLYSLYVGSLLQLQLTLVISNSMGPWKKFETTWANFWRAKTSIACPYSRNDFKHIRCFCCCFFLSVKFFEFCETTDNF
jgi:hypothetical protein